MKQFTLMMAATLMLVACGDEHRWANTANMPFSNGKPKFATEERGARGVYWLDSAGSGYFATLQLDPSDKPCDEVELQCQFDHMYATVRFTKPMGMPTSAEADLPGTYHLYHPSYPVADGEAHGVAWFEIEPQEGTLYFATAGSVTIDSITDGKIKGSVRLTLDSDKSAVVSARFTTERDEDFERQEVLSQSADGL